MKPSSPEVNKRPGVHYAVTADGLELPIVDVTHPAFALNISATEQKKLVAKFLQDGIPLQKLPAALRAPVLRFFLRGSYLARGIRQAQGTFMSGLDTDMLKLGPEMLGDAYAKSIDRKIAAGLPALAVRLRLQDMAELMAETLLPALSDARRPLHFINIAGGPAIDSLNALILLNRNQPGVLAGRPVFISVLDSDSAGPAFGEAALAELSGRAAPLYGLEVSFRHVPYDWSEVTTLKQVLSAAHNEGALVICSSEGGLFEYGIDDEISANLNALRTSSEVLAVVGSVTRADEPIRSLRYSSTTATRPRGLDVFRSLSVKSGWQVARVIERPFSDHVVLA